MNKVTELVKAIEAQGFIKLNGTASKTGEFYFFNQETGKEYITYQTGYVRYKSPRYHPLNRNTLYGSWMGVLNKIERIKGKYTTHCKIVLFNTIEERLEKILHIAKNYNKNKNS